MHLNIIAVGKKMPHWISEGFEDYAKRFSKDISVSLIEITPEKRGNQTAAIVKEREGERILEAIANLSPQKSPKSYTIALDVLGKSYSTETLAQKLSHHQSHYSSLNFVIGGADGLSKTCLEHANELWSLSPLTFPHALVRVVLIEQLYRAYSLLNNHPYHRQ